MSGLKRVPISRSTKPMKRGRLNPVSKKRRAENAVRAEIPMKDHCEAHRAGMPGPCFGPLTRHEVLPRGRGGSITDPANIKTVCNGHNTAISQDVETMRWALTNGFLKHADRRVGKRRAGA